MKPVAFLGRSLEDLREFPDDARRIAGFQLDKVQRGLDADDWKAMPAIGAGVREIRIAESGGAFRIIYVARFAEAVYVLHCFRKESAEDSSAGHRHGGAALSRTDPEQKMKAQQFSSVWDAIENDREVAASLKARSELMLALQATVRRWNVPQTEAARRLAITQPRLSDLLRGRIEKFSLDALFDLLARAGRQVTVKVRAAA